MNQEAQCKDCMEKFELVPPADGAYSVPREKSTSADYIERYYECKNGHRNTIYWEQPVNIVSGSYKTEEMRKREGGGRAEGSSSLSQRRGDDESLFI